MNIAIIGAGNIGGTLGRKWAAAGYGVVFGVREPADPKHAELASLGAVVSVDTAIERGDVVVLAQPGSAIPEFAVLYGAALGHKAVIDTTNNVRGAEMHNLPVLLENAPEARFARAFNTLGWENMQNPQLGGSQVDLFFCSHPEIRPLLEELIGAVGLNPIYIGDLSSAAVLDGLTRLWFALAFGQAHGRRVAFKLLQE